MPSGAAGLSPETVACDDLQPLTLGSESDPVVDANEREAGRLPLHSKEGRGQLETVGGAQTVGA